MKKKIVTWMKSAGVIATMFIFLSAAIGDAQVRSHLNKERTKDNSDNIETISGDMVSKKDLDLRMALLNYKMDNMSIVIISSQPDEIKELLERNYREIKVLEGMIIQQGISSRGDTPDDYEDLFNKMLEANKN